MRFIKQSIKDLRLILPELHEDDRGIFRRSFCKSELLSEGVDFEVKQGNISQNFKKHTMRGFHYQVAPSEESKFAPSNKTLKAILNYSKSVEVIETKRKKKLLINLN